MHRLGTGNPTKEQIEGVGVAVLRELPGIVDAVGHIPGSFISSCSLSKASASTALRHIRKKRPRGIQQLRHASALTANESTADVAFGGGW